MLSLPLLPPRMKPAITMLATRADKGARADIGQFRGRCLIEVVDFNQGYTRGVILASHDRRIRSGSQGRMNR